MGQDRAQDSNFYDIHSVFANLNPVERAVEAAAVNLGYRVSWGDPYQAEPISKERESVGQHKVRQVNLLHGWWPKGAVRIHYDQMAEDLKRTSMLEFVRGPVTHALNEVSDIGEFCDRFDHYLETFDYQLPTNEPEKGLVELSDQRRENLEEIFNNLGEDFSELED